MKNIAARALLVAPRYAARPDNGAGQRTQLLARALASRFSLDVLAIGEDEALDVADAFPVAARVLQPSFAPEGEAADAYRADEAVLRAAGDLSAYGLTAARYFGPAAKAGLFAAGAPPLLLDLDDRDDLTLEEPARAAAAAAMARLLPEAAHVFVTAEEAAAGLSHPSVSVLPNAVWSLPEKPPPSCGEPVLLFVGTAHHGPNARGLREFLGRVWPLIIDAMPAARLHVAGKGWDEALPPQAGLRLLGFVPEVREAYAGAAAAVCPLNEGGGTKIKIAEAMAHARPAVAHAHSARGFGDAVAAGAVISAQTPEETAAAVLALLRDPEDCARRGALGAAYAEARHAPAAFEREVLRACEAGLAFRGGIGHKPPD